MRLPQDVEVYLDKYLPREKLNDDLAAWPDLCKACPQRTRSVDTANDPVCQSCPWWGALYGAFCAAHWHRRRPGHKASSPPDHPHD